MEENKCELLDKSSECSREITKIFKERIDDIGYTWTKVSQPTKTSILENLRIPPILDSLRARLRPVEPRLCPVRIGTRGSTPKFLGHAFDAAVQRMVDALLPGLTTRLTNEIRQNDARGSVDVEKWIAHIEKIFEVLGCADEFKARLASYKLEGDALNWWKAFKQAKRGETYVATLSWKDFCDIFFLQYFPRFEHKKYDREYHMIRQRDGETSGELMKRFLRLAGFVGKKAGPQEEQAKHFKWALCD
ncbi:zinc finger, CCHC-type, retrotransposon gag domain protein [Tanacetum coccineum]